MSAAGSDLPVRIAGPPGSGKEHLARAIHAWSGRNGGPFVAIACAGVAEALLSRELFGCAASVYPTLPDAYEGALSRAEGGTLLIDRSDRLPNALREDLARAISDKQFKREGDATPLPLNARIIATSLEPFVRSPFGELPQHEIALQPLAERTEDILPL
ncbi:MAG TPA: sigma 54-interacting transcriptional regulator, partial [Myxococcota bacterium]